MCCRASDSTTGMSGLKFNNNKSILKANRNYKDPSD